MFLCSAYTYFIRTVRKALLPHFLQAILPWRTFMCCALVLALQSLQTNTFLYNRTFASGNLAIFSSLIFFYSLISDLNEFNLINRS
jgi:hypothetical protein